MRLSPLLALTQFRVFRVRSRIVAKVDSIGLAIGMIEAVSIPFTPIDDKLEEREDLLKDADAFGQVPMSDSHRQWVE